MAAAPRQSIARPRAGAGAALPSPRARAGAAIGRAALRWFAVHGRDLSFRRTRDPWAVLVSEVMAQQTQAARAAEAWEAFIGRYPTAAAFAAISPAEAIRAWRGLGYNRRAVALRAAAVRIVEGHDGRVPDDLAALEALPGIGPYTARAIVAIAFGRRVAALDTNIRRVLDRALGRLEGSERALQSSADALVPRGRAAEWTHALMDIGATFCRKRDPRCEACPLAETCAFARAATHAGALTATAAARTAGARRAPARAAGDGDRPRSAKRPRFETTTRWLRGRILDRLRDAPDGAWTRLDAGIGGHDRGAVQRALAALAAEGLVELHRALPTDARLAAG